MRFMKPNLSWFSARNIEKICFIKKFNQRLRNFLVPPYPTQSVQNFFRTERCGIQSYTSRVKDGIGNGTQKGRHKTLAYLFCPIGSSYFIVFGDHIYMFLFRCLMNGGHTVLQPIRI